MKLIICFMFTWAVAMAHVMPLAEQYPNGRITNGETAAPDQYPYQVGMVVNSSGESGGWCGGSLIANNWVLTAAHCLYNADSVVIHFGSNIRNDPAVKRHANTSDFIIHPGFNYNNIDDDIALIKIKNVNYAKDIQPVRLPFKFLSRRPSFVGVSTFVAGWGTTTNSSNASNLQYVELRVIPNCLCKDAYGSNVIAPSKICVSTPHGESTCSGDSGGPLVLARSKIQIGVVSFGSYNCVIGYPDVFTRVTSYLDWITENTGISG